MTHTVLTNCLPQLQPSLPSSSSVVHSIPFAQRGNDFASYLDAQKRRNINHYYFPPRSSRHPVTGRRVARPCCLSDGRCPMARAARAPSTRRPVPLTGRPTTPLEINDHGQYTLQQFSLASRISRRVSLIMLLLSKSKRVHPTYCTWCGNRYL